MNMTNNLTVWIRHLLLWCMALLALPAWAAVSVSFSLPANGVMQSLASPPVQTVYYSPGNIGMAAMAVSAPPGGTTQQAAPAIVSVDFLVNGEIVSHQTLGYKTQFAYLGYSWPIRGPGTYTLSARATDAAGTSATSRLLTVTAVTSHSPPGISLTAPAANASPSATPGIALSAIAYPYEANGTLSSVEFLVDGQVIGSLAGNKGVWPLGSASPYPSFNFTWKGATSGSHVITARATDAQGLQTTTSPITINVKGGNTAATTTTLTVSPNPVTPGQAITITATVTGSNPTGSVTFKDGGATLGSASLSNGQASLATSFATAGAHSLTAVYAGDANNAGSTSAAASLTVNAATSATTLAASPNPITVGQSVTLSASVTGSNPTGSVTFKEGGTVLGSTSLANGQASLVTSFASAGAHSLTAVYEGDANNAGSTSTAINLLVSAVVTDPAVNVPVVRYEYDAMDNQTRRTDGLGHITTNSFDALDRLVTQLQPHPTTSGTLGQVQVQYDGQSNPKLVTDPRSLATQYTIDGLGNLTRLVSPDTGVTTYTYDAAGNVLSKTDARGVVTSYSYDALNRLTQAQYAKSGSPTQIITYQYDQGDNGIGRLTQVSDDSGSVTWQYDAHGRVTSRTQTLAAATPTNPGAAASLSRQTQYDNAGRVQTITTPGGRQIGYSYDTLGQISQISIDGSAALTNIAWQSFGPVAGWQFHNLPYARQYDTAGRITATTLGGQARSLAWDAANRITLSADYPLSNPTTPGNGRAYGYDNLDRLTSAIDTSSNQGYSYDLNGNRVSLILGANSYPYSVDPNSNRLLGTQGPLPQKHYSYDAAGNPVSDGRNTYVYDNRNRIASLTSSGITTVYAYNGLGERVAKAGNGSVTRYVYDDGGHLIGEYDQNGAPIEETVWLGDIPVLVLMPGGQVYAIDTDHLDTPRVIKDSAGSVVWSWENADPFGANLPDEDPDHDGTKFTYNLRFPGQVYDKESNLHYNYFRNYDPGVGGYTQSDPIGLAGGQFSTYSYVGGRPLSKKDPSGLWDGNEEFPGDPPPYPWPQPEDGTSGNFPETNIPMHAPETCCDDEYQSCIYPNVLVGGIGCMNCVRSGFTNLRACASCSGVLPRIAACRQRHCGEKQCSCKK